MAELLHEGKFVNKFKTEAGYEFCSRKKVPYLDGNTKPDAVTIVAVFNNQIVFVKEQRPAIGKPMISFPAGLIDEGETVEQAAIRELKEETGLDVVSCNTFKDESFTSAGMSDEQNALAYCFCTGSIKTEPGIEVVLCDIYNHDTLAELIDGAKSSQVLTFILGVAYGMTSVMHKHIGKQLDIHGNPCVEQPNEQ